MRATHRSVLLSAALSAFVAAPLLGQTQTLAGRLSVVWEVASGGPEPAIVFRDSTGRGWILDLDAEQRRSLGPPQSIAGKTAIVTAPMEPRRTGALTPSVVHPASIATGMPSGAQSQSTLARGPVPWVTLLCKFADSPLVEPITPAEGAVVMGSTYPGVANFFAELSDGAADLSGNTVAGWFLLPLPRSAYVAQNVVDFQRLLSDCAAAADSVIDFSQYFGINLQFNGLLDQRTVPPYDQLSHGGQSGLSIDGVNRLFGVTWLASPFARNYIVITHEMGHGFGWPHSSGPYSQTYDSKWDLMSAGYAYLDPTFGWLGGHTIAYHKDMVGWYTPAEAYRAAAIDSVELTLERTALPPPGSVRMVRVPLRTEPGKFYTIEARNTAGYDRGLPGEAIILHKVDSTLADRQAQVVDPDGNGNPNDDGAMWIPGETFRDSVNDVVLTVLGATTTGYQIRVTVGRTLTLALGSVGRHQSVTLASHAVLSDSVPVSLLGPAADTVRWTASHGTAAWLSLPSSSGTGNSVLRWTIDASALGTGTWVDTIDVAATNARGSPARIVDTLVVFEPVLSAACGAGDLMGSFCLDSESRSYLDDTGNHDGTYNLGDLLAYLDRKHLTLDRTLMQALTSGTLGPRRSVPAHRRD